MTDRHWPLGLSGSGSWPQQGHGSWPSRSGAPWGDSISRGAASDFGSFATSRRLIFVAATAVNTTFAASHPFTDLARDSTYKWTFTVPNGVKVLKVRMWGSPGNLMTDSVDYLPKGGYGEFFLTVIPGNVVSLAAGEATQGGGAGGNGHGGGGGWWGGGPGYEGGGSFAGTNNMGFGGGFMGAGSGNPAYGGGRGHQRLRLLDGLDGTRSGFGGSGSRIEVGGVTKAMVGGGGGGGPYMGNGNGDGGGGGGLNMPGVAGWTRLTPGYDGGGAGTPTAGGAMGGYPMGGGGSGYADLSVVTIIRTATGFVDIADPLWPSPVNNANNAPGALILQW